MVTKVIFLQDLFGFSKNGQKKCPKLKIPNTFGKKNKVNIINSPKGLKPTEKRELLTSDLANFAVFNCL